MAVGRAEHAAAADEPELIERARTDPEAFATLYRRHVDRIHRHGFEAGFAQQPARAIGAN